MYIGTGKKKLEAKLKHIFMVGQKVLFFIDRDDPKNEIRSLTNYELSKRLYFVKTLFDARAQRIIFQHHMESRTDEQLQIDFPRDVFGTRGKDGFSDFVIDFVAPRLLLTPTKFDFLIEGKDFKMKLDGSIEFLD